MEGLSEEAILEKPQSAGILGCTKEGYQRKAAFKLSSLGET